VRHESGNPVVEVAMGGVAIHGVKMNEKKLETLLLKWQVGHVCRVRRAPPGARGTEHRTVFNMEFNIKVHHCDCR
jgi:hypothetical protein